MSLHACSIPRDWIRPPITGNDRHIGDERAVIRRLRYGGGSAANLGQHTYPRPRILSNTVVKTNRTKKRHYLCSLGSLFSLQLKLCLQ
jgi:hypothetical protein